MAKKGEVKEAEEEVPRPMGGEERVERTTARGEDLFDDFLSGGTKKAEELGGAVDRNGEDILGRDEEPEDEDDDGEDDGEEDDEEKSGAEPAEVSEKVASGSGKTKKDEEEETEEDEPEEGEQEPWKGEEEQEEKGDKEEENSGEEPVKEEGGEKEPEPVKLKGRQGEESGEGDEEAGEDESLDFEEHEFDFDTDHDAHEEHESKGPEREEIKKTILEKAGLAAMAGAPQDIDMAAEKLSFLHDAEKQSVFIGMKGGIYRKYGYEGTLRIGNVKEKEYENWNVHLDSLNPHVVFVCGSRGSGKSYVLGVIAEELAEKNKNIGIIVVDPIGVFWSMRFPNKEEREVERLKELGLEPGGIDNLKVFIPDGMKNQVPKATFDAGFSIQPSLLTGEDWALTFGVDRFSVSGLLLDKVLKKVEKGYKKMDSEKKVKPKASNYSLNDLIECLETDAELNSRDKGYKPDSIRAIASRFEAAKHWGIFHEKGTPLGRLAREGQLTILDTSFLEDNVTALVIGLLARRLLAARKISTRKEAASRFKSLSTNELLELEIPPTWLFIDEAHTLIPSGNEVTAATHGLIEYVKQGRRPGLSLVFATQQPSAINTKVLSQLDVIMSHKLIFDDDIKAVFKRTPTIMPRKYRNPNFIKTLPVGVAVTGDRREETSRAFVMAIRPRKSQHEGRDAETTGMAESVDEKQVESMAIEMLMRDVKQEKELEMEKAQLAIDTLNTKYRTKVKLERVLKELEKKGLEVGPEMIRATGHQRDEKPLSAYDEDSEEREFDEEQTALGKYDGEVQTMEKASGKGQAEPAEKIELLAMPTRIEEQAARRIVEKVRKKRFFGLLGPIERIESMRLKHLPVWRIRFDSAARRGEFIARECFVNSMTGEFVHFQDGEFVESKGLVRFAGLNEEETRVVKALMKKELLLEEVMAHAELEEARVRRVLQKLIESGIIGRLSDKQSDKVVYFLKEKLDLPPSETHKLLGSLAELPFVRTEALSVEPEKVTKEQVAETLKKIWKNAIVKKIEPLYKPVWHIILSEDAKERVVLIDAVNGKIIDK